MAKYQARAGYFESPAKPYSSPFTSPDSNPGNNRKRNQPLYPVTITQLQNAQQVTPDTDDFLLNGNPLYLVCIIGQIVKSQALATHLNYVIDDSTGNMDVRRWVDTQGGGGEENVELGPGKYIRVIGNLRSFGDKRYVVASSQLMLIEDFNELTHHFLEIIHMTLQSSGNRSSKSLPASDYSKPMINSNPNNRAPANTNTHMKTGNNKGLSDLQGEIKSFVLDNQGEDQTGVAIDKIVETFQDLYGVGEVRKAVGYLIDEGHFFNTTDSNTVAVTEEF